MHSRTAAQCVTRDGGQQQQQRRWRWRAAAAVADNGRGRLPPTVGPAQRDPSLSPTDGEGGGAEARARRALQRTAGENFKFSNSKLCRGARSFFSSEPNSGELRRDPLRTHGSRCTAHRIVIKISKPTLKHFELLKGTGIEPYLIMVPRPINKFYVTVTITCSMRRTTSQSLWFQILLQKGGAISAPQN